MAALVELAAGSFDVAAGVLTYTAQPLPVEHEFGDATNHNKTELGEGRRACMGACGVTCRFQLGVECQPAPFAAAASAPLQLSGWRRPTNWHAPCANRTPTTLQRSRAPLVAWHSFWTSRDAPTAQATAPSAAIA